MKVANLQQYLGDLAKLLQSTDAKKSAAELFKIAEGLDHFKEYDLAAFADFLARAEDYSRTGTLPVVAPKGVRGSTKQVTPKSDISAIRAEVERTYHAASSPELTIESIEGLRPKLVDLTKADLASIASAIGLVGMTSKTKPVILDAVLSRIRSIKQTAMRTSIIDRPGTLF